MARTETVELTVLCLLHQNGQYLLQDRVKKDSSEEGRMHWVKVEDLDKVNLVNDFKDLLDVMLDDKLSEFQYVIEDNKWNIVKK